jgi:hypothetical protein
MQRQTKLIVTLLIGALLLFGVWSTALFISRRGLDKIEVQAIPSDSQIYVDGKAVSAGTLYVSPGKHTLEATREYFTKHTKTINTGAVQHGSIIYLLPEPNSPKADQWLAEHPEEARTRESIVADITTKSQTDLLRKYPILSKLPVYNSHYRIDYDLTETSQLSFSITLYAIINGPADRDRYLYQLQQYKAEALKFLIDNGINVDEAKIDFTPRV